MLSGLQESIGANRTTTPTYYDIDYRGNISSEVMRSEAKVDGGNSIHAFASLELVSENLRNNDVRNMKLIEGDVAITLKKSNNLPKKIAILRLDTN